MNVIVVVDQNWGIGKNNDLLFHIPKDLAYFKEKTANKVVVMGGNTLLSLPNSKPLPKRVNIVLTDAFKRDDCIVVETLSELFEELKKYPSNDLFIIGGAMFYKTMLPYCNRAYITKVDANGGAVHFFNNIDKMQNWQLESESETFSDNGYNFKFTIYNNTKVEEYGKN
jgi:dihydrofolate reductase